MYFGDMGGRVFRMDIINGNAASTLVSGGMIAALGGGELVTPTDDNSRRFYYAPDIAVIRDRTLGTYLHVGIGSGYREHPLVTTQTDRFFAMRDTNVYNIPASYAYGITEANLYDITDNVIGEGSAAAAAAAQTILKSSKGWYINLLNGTTKEGEKVLAEARTVAGQVLFTTFTPVATTAATETCAPSQGTAKLYVVNAANALPVADLNQSGSTTTLTAGDRARTLVRGGIPPEVTILYPEISQDHPIGLVGPEKVPVDLSNAPVKTYWLQEDSDDGD
jgi:type IV pilus assembly protein PilY1